MCNVICVTNRALCNEPFSERLARIVQTHPAAVILREKDLPEDQYRALAACALEICRAANVPCILHTFVDIARELQPDGLHLPMHLLRQLSEEQRRSFQRLGASCHSVEEAQEARALGCTYITAGHIFATDCKKGLAGRGLDFLRSVCESVSIPVYAIGGIEPARLPVVLAAGASGACVMSGLMRCADPAAYLEEFEKAGKTYGY